MARVRSTEQSGVSGETTRGKRRETRSAEHGAIRGVRRNHQAKDEKHGTIRGHHEQLK